MLIKKIPILTNMLLDGVKKKMCFLWDWNEIIHTEQENLLSRWGRRRRSVNNDRTFCCSPLTQGTSREVSDQFETQVGKNDFSTKLNVLGKTHSFMRWNSAQSSNRGKGTEPVARQHEHFAPAVCLAAPGATFGCGTGENGEMPCHQWVEAEDAIVTPDAWTAAPSQTLPLPTQQRRIPSTMSMVWNGNTSN